MTVLARSSWGHWAEHDLSRFEERHGWLGRARVDESERGFDRYDQCFDEPIEEDRP